MELQNRIKKAVYLFVTAYHLVFIVLLNLSVLFFHKNASLSLWIAFELLLILLTCVYYLMIKFTINKFFHKAAGKQNIILNFLFKNTKVIINNFSHEIRTPLNAILGFADNLYEIETDPLKREYLQAIKNNSERLFSMATKLIDHSVIETGQFIIDRDYFNNDSLIMDLVSKFKTDIEKKGLQFFVENKVPDNFQIKSDYRIIFEILEMLIENALKFTNSGSIVIESDYNNKTLYYSVCDTGCGVPEDKKDLIFQLYRQGNSNMDRKFEGLGLGLTLALKLAHLLGGSIKFENNKEGGSCFKLLLSEPFRIIENQHSSDSGFIFPENISEADIFELKKIAGELSENIRVFNPVSIKKIGEELKKKDKLFTEFSNKLFRVAETYNESELSLLVEELYKGIGNED